MPQRDNGDSSNGSKSNGHGEVEDTRKKKGPPEDGGPGVVNGGSHTE
jgi:hypothetical protein